MTDRRRLRETFEQVRELYDRARPSYPAELFDDLTTLAGLGAGARILELGPGTGKATVSLAQRGFLWSASSSERASRQSPAETWLRFRRSRS